MRSYTTGPWVVAEDWQDGERKEYFVSRPDGDPMAIASNIIDPANNNEQSEANALLIAAAPDLLVALELVVAIADRSTIEFDKARAAIAKAKGEKQ